MSGIVTLHELDNSKSTLPPKNTASFTLKFVYVSGHLRWAQVRLSEFEGRFLKSYISSLPCCDKASVETFDLYIDRVHSRCYGEGKWLNAQRVSLSHDLPAGNCSDKEHSALRLLDVSRGKKRPRHVGVTSEAQQGGGRKRPRKHTGTVSNTFIDERSEETVHNTGSECLGNESFEKQVGEIRAKVFELSKPVSSKTDDQNWHTKFSEHRNVFDEESQRLAKCLDDLAPSMPSEEAAVTKVKELLPGAVEVACFVDVVTKNVANLKAAVSNDLWSSQPFAQFLEHCKPQRNPERTEFENVWDIGTRLESFLSYSRKQLSRHIRDLKAEFKLYQTSIEVLKAFLLDAKDRMMETSSSEVPSEALTPSLHRLITADLAVAQATGVKTKKKHKDDKKYAGQKRRASVFINKVIDKLFGKVGANALTIYTALQGSVFISLASIKPDHVEFLVDSAATALEESDIKDLPPDYRVLHVPAVLSWLLDLDYQIVCQGLQLPLLAQNNPNVSSQLDELVSDISSLRRKDPGSGRLQTLNHLVRNAMKPTLLSLGRQPTTVRGKNFNNKEDGVQHELTQAPSCPSNGTIGFSTNLHSVPPVQPYSQADQIALNNETFVGVEQPERPCEIGPASGWLAMSVGELDVCERFERGQVPGIGTKPSETSGSLGCNTPGAGIGMLPDMTILQAMEWNISFFDVEAADDWTPALQTI